jgi:hypothetical protein
MTRDEVTDDRLAYHSADLDEQKAIMCNLY